MTSRKFECWQCHRRFEADDSSWVECPYCHSDNVEYAHIHLPKGLWKWMLGVLVCASVAWVLFNMEWSCSKQPAKGVIPSIPTDSVTDGDSIEVPNDSIMNDLGLKVSPTVIIKGTPAYEDGYYSCDVTVKNAPPAGSYYVVILDHFDHQHIVARSSDGHFSQLPPSENDGQYDFAVCTSKGDSLLCEPVPRTGFLPQKAVTVRMTKEELQKLIDTEDDSLYGQGKNSYIAPDCKLSFSGLPADATEIPVTLYEVAEKVGTGKWSITVTQIDYDDMNRISAVSIEVK